MTDAKTWADGPDLASFVGPNTDAQCWDRCIALPACKLSIRDPATGACFLKAKSPLLPSLDLSTTYCAPAMGAPFCHEAGPAIERAPSS